MDANTLQQFFMLCLKSFTAYGFRVYLVLCDGASSNVTLLKLLCGYPRTTLPVNDVAEDLRARYFVDMSFTNPEYSSGNPVFVMICPSYQVVIMLTYLVTSISTCLLCLEKNFFVLQTFLSVKERDSSRVQFQNQGFQDLYS